MVAVVPAAVVEVVAAAVVTVVVVTVVTEWVEAAPRAGCERDGGGGRQRRWLLRTTADTPTTRGRAC